MAKINHSAILHIPDVFQKIYIFDRLPLLEDKQTFIDEFKDDPYLKHGKALVKFFESRIRRILPYLPDRRLLLTEIDELTVKDTRRLINDLRLLVVTDYQIREKIRK